MNNYNIAVIPGDGIGIEVVDSALKVLDKVSNNNNFKLNYSFYDWGSNYYFKK